jgi:hypothetical protein
LRQGFGFGAFFLFIISITSGGEDLKKIYLLKGGISFYFKGVSLKKHHLPNLIILF